MSAEREGKRSPAVVTLDRQQKGQKGENLDDRSDRGVRGDDKDIRKDSKGTTRATAETQRRGGNSNERKKDVGRPLGKDAPQKGGGGGRFKEGARTKKALGRLEGKQKGAGGRRLKIEQYRLSLAGKRRARRGV